MELFSPSLGYRTEVMNPCVPLTMSTLRLYQSSGCMPWNKSHTFHVQVRMVHYNHRGSEEYYICVNM